MSTSVDEDLAESSAPNLAPSNLPLDDHKPHHTRNFVLLACHNMLLRCGWIFKTESIIMPAVVDTLGGPPWLRGCLPLLNRFGQSVPPMLMSRRVKVAPQKKWMMLACVLCMSTCFLVLAGIWHVYGERTHWWMAPTFLLIYGAFFVSTGIYNMTFTTLQGKLIRTKRRGRLLLTANILGAFFAISAVGLLLPMWLRKDGEEFRFIFGFAGMMFGISGLLMLFVVEPVDNYDQAVRTPRQLLGDAVKTLRNDRHFRRLAIIGALFGCSMTLFPHYQAIGRSGHPELKLTMLISWVMVQNAGTALFSLIAGPLADRFGNRLAARAVLLMMCIAPAWTLILDTYGSAMQWGYNLVFVLVGLTPIVFRILNNYTLELAKPKDHPRYLSTLSLCIAVPALLAPAVGWLVGAIGFAPVFIVIGSLIFIGWLLTFGLHEPRHHLKKM